MLLLLADSILLIFNILSLGILSIYGVEKLFRVSISSDLLGIFLMGIFASAIYFNMVSFWLPVNYLSLLPLTILSFVVLYILPDKVRQIGHSIRHSLKCIFSPLNLFISLCLAATLFFYGIMPAGNTDSSGYHYLAILWYETYKVVPGLANIHGRLAYNSISFIIQAAYSFTGPAGQSIYPLNSVLTGLFFAWLLVKMLKRKDSPAGLVYGFLIILLYRPLLINISSPSSDALADVCMAYAMVRLFEILLSGKIGLSLVLIPSLVILCSLTAKLYSFPVLLALPYIFFLLPKKEKEYPFLLKVFGIGLLLYLPWIVRTYIMSGYMIYPFPHLNFFHPDWQVSSIVLRHDVFYIHEDPFGMPFANWLFHPLSFSLKNVSANLLLLIAAMLSPFCWLILYKRARKTTYSVFAGWLIIYAGVWIWFFTAPGFRFGAVLLALSLAFPFLASLSGSPQVRSRLYPSLISLLFISAAIYYIKTGLNKPTTYAFTVADCWLYPLKDSKYKNNKGDFPYTTLRNGVKLYREDSTHKCINTDLPCSMDYTGEVEMRGDRIDQGFRTIKTLPTGNR